jgi:hypothetical protein
VVEQPPLSFKAASKTSQRSIGADDTMAGKHNANRICPIGSAHRPSGSGDTESLRLLSVARGFSEGDISERVPGRQLKGRPQQIERDIESHPGAGEVFVELLNRPTQDRMVPCVTRYFGRGMA